jgi:hypothetical protein
MRRIVLPFIPTAAITADVVYSVATADIGIAIEVVIVVDVDVTATPSGAPAPTAAPGSTHGPTNAKRDCAGSDHGSS